MNHSIIQNMDSSSKEASGCGECPSKDRATGESWRKGEIHVPYALMCFAF